MRRIETSHERFSEIKEALVPIRVHNTPNQVVAGREEWTADSTLDAFKTSSLDAKFSCNCGESFVPNGMHRCACGQTWNSSVISTNEKQASQSLKIVRPVPEFRERVLASKSKKKLAGWVKHSVESAGIPSFVRSANETNGGDVAPTVFEKQADVGGAGRVDNNTGDTPPAASNSGIGGHGEGTYNPKAMLKQDQWSGTELYDNKTVDGTPSFMSGGSDRALKTNAPANLTGTGPTTMPNTSMPSVDTEMSVQQPAGGAVDNGMDTDMGNGSDRVDPGISNLINPMGTAPRSTDLQTAAAAGAGAASQPAAGYTPPKVAPPKAAPAKPQAKPQVPPTQNMAPATNPAPAQIQWGPQNGQKPPLPGMQPLAQPIAGQPGVAIPGQQAVQPIQQARTYNMTFSEDDYRMGWALASSDAPLPNRALHSSLIEGYRDFYREVVADYAPGYDSVSHLFEESKDGVTNGMDDRADAAHKDLSSETKEMRSDIADKLDRDNAKGQNRDKDGSMTDLTGWKTSALAAELQRRLSGE